MIVLLADPPRPSPDEAREQLRHELLKTEYQRDDPFQRLVDWINGFFSDSVDKASRLEAVPTLAAMLVFLLLVIGLGLLLSRARSAARRAAAAESPLLPDRVSAGAYRRRAEQALAEGRYADAVVDGFRALAARQIERGRLEEHPDATAREVAGQLAGTYATHGAGVHGVALLFDAVRYGDHPATRDEANRVLGLDDALAGAR